MTKKRFIALAMLILAAWLLVYDRIIPVSKWISYDLLGLDAASSLGAAVEFFLYDTAKILLLLSLMVYVLAYARASLNLERVRAYIVGKKKAFGYFLGASFGAITPFCSCSSIPLFLGFTSAGIPIGITMSFLVTSPLINEVAIVVLWGLLGPKFTLIYVVVGMLAGIISGIVMDLLKAERYLQPFLIEAINKQANGQANLQNIADYVAPKMTYLDRHHFAYTETASIFSKVWKWVLIGVALGALLHGYVPEEWFAENLGKGQIWSVPLAVLLGIPLYTNVTGIIPIMESLLMKGLPIGTTLAFCMSTVAVSLPEILMLKQVMTPKLLAIFIGILLVLFTLVGYLFNALSFLL